jgi:uncharacterized integral membrane protein
MPATRHTRKAATAQTEAERTAAAFVPGAFPTVRHSGAGTGDSRPARRSRTGVSWLGMWAIVIVLAVFMLQNTRPVPVSFLGMHGSLPLALGLLIAAVGGMLVTLVIGIGQLRRRGHSH